MKVSRLNEEYCIYRSTCSSDESRVPNLHHSIRPVPFSLHHPYSMSLLLTSSALMSYTINDWHHVLWCVQGHSPTDCMEQAGARFNLSWSWEACLRRMDRVRWIAQRGGLWEPCQGITGARMMFSKMSSSPSMHHQPFTCKTLATLWESSSTLFSYLCQRLRDREQGITRSYDLEHQSTYPPDS